MIKMILSDMDGTLLDNNGCMPPDFDEVMSLLKERGVLFAPASGRQYTAIINQMPEYESELAFISENGAVAMYKGETIFTSPIPKDSILNLLKKMMSDEETYPVLCGKTCCYVEKKWEPYLGFLEEFLSKYEIVDDLFAAIEKEEIIKIAFGDFPRGRAEERLYPLLAESVDAGLKVMLSSAYWVDVLNDGICKGTAIKGLQEKLGIKPEECVAFGDYLNDIEMLQSVKYGYAMANAHPEVIKAAKLFAPANNKNGVMRTIRKLIEDGLV